MTISPINELLLSCLIVPLINPSYISSQFTDYLTFLKNMLAVIINVVSPNLTADS